MRQFFNSRIFLAKRKPLNPFLSIKQSALRFWYASECLIKNLYFSFYKIKSKNYIQNRFNSKITKVKLPNELSNKNIKFNEYHIRNFSKKWYCLNNHLFNCFLNSPLERKCKQNFKSNFYSLSFIGFSIHQNALDEEIKWIKFRNLLKNLITETKYNNFQFEENEEKIFNLDNIIFEKYIAKGCSAAVYEASLKNSFNLCLENKFAVKVLFNYDIESNACSIMQSMNKEYICYNGVFGKNINIKTKKKNLSHPNVIKIYSVFVDSIPDLPSSKKIFGSALPSRLYEYGFGRNMTLFLVMKKYHLNLKNYLETNKPKTDVSLLLLSQLFEGVYYLNKNKIAHRDLKTDNILLDLNFDKKYPWLVITDFGTCCTSLNIPYINEETIIGGNLALMAPEIICAKPGFFSRLHYETSDIWTCGTLAYEIFNNSNPFYPDKNGKSLNSGTYYEYDLQEPADNMPTSVKKLVRKILNRNPYLRPNAKICSTLCNLIIFYKESTLIKISSYLYNDKILTKKINLLLNKTSYSSKNNYSKAMMRLKLLFLIDLQIDHIKTALEYFKSQNFLITYKF